MNDTRAPKPSILELIKYTFQEWINDQAMVQGAALAYYTIFALSPLLIIVVWISGLFFEADAVQGRLSSEVESMIGPKAALMIENLLANMGTESTAAYAKVLSILVLIFGATGVFVQLQSSLNVIWEVAPKGGRGITGVLRDRLVSFLMVAGVGVLLLAALVAAALVSALEGSLQGLIPGAGYLWQLLNISVSFALTAVLFGAIFYYLPDVKISWKDVWVGALVTSALFTLGKYFIGLYLGTAGFSTTYGAAGALAAILAWIFYSSQIFFLGAEFTQVYAAHFGRRIVPADNAVPIQEAARFRAGYLQDRQQTESGG